MTSRRVFFESAFEPTEHGHGGCHRALQVVELIRRAGFETATIPQPSSGLLHRVARGLAFARRHPHTLRYPLRAVRGCGYLAARFDGLSTAARGLAVVWESTQTVYLPDAAHDAGLPVLAVPQNLEALVSPHGHPATHQRMPASFESELRGLASADAVFTISREEQWLLRLRGVAAEHLPYHPPEALRPGLGRIRAVRSARTTRGRFVILGTADNPPTRAGMLEQIDWLTPLLTARDGDVDVVGFGTEQLRPRGPGDRFVLHGGVSAERLAGLLGAAAAVLVHQRSGAGALTRIPEMLGAGVPVIANAIAGRSAMTYPGVHCYDSIDELRDLLRRDLEDPPTVPPPADAEHRFIECLGRLTRSPSHGTHVP